MNRAIPYLIAVLLTACGIEKPASTTMNSPTITVRTDVSLLSQRITLPDGVETAKWVVLPLGSLDSTVPGPTDTVLYAFLTFNSKNWSSMQALSATTPNAPSSELPEKVAKQILPTTKLKEFVREDEQIRVKGRLYNPNYFNKGAYRGLYAVQLGDGLLVCLQTL